MAGRSAGCSDHSSYRLRAHRKRQHALGQYHLLKPGNVSRETKHLVRFLRTDNKSPLVRISVRAGFWRSLKLSGIKQQNVIDDGLQSLVSCGFPVRDEELIDDDLFFEFTGDQADLWSVSILLSLVVPEGKGDA